MQIKKGKATISAVNLTPYAKRLVAQAMYVKGKNFLGAAVLLRQHGGYEYVVLHNLAQGIELILKSILLLLDYDKNTQKRLKLYYGHNLIKLADDVVSQLKLRPMRLLFRKEVEQIDYLYRHQFLRYGTPHDIFIGPPSMGMDRVLVRMAAVLRLFEKYWKRSTQ